MFGDPRNSYNYFQRLQTWWSVPLTLQAPRGSLPPPPPDGLEVGGGGGGGLCRD
jgi:hypothetical protein